MASYSIQDKIRILKRVIEDGESKSFVAASEGCDRHSIDAWIKQYSHRGEDGLKCNRGFSKYSDTLKQEVIQYKHDHHSSSSVYLSKRFGIPVSTIKLWLRDAATDADETLESCEFNSNALVAQLIRENQRLRMENDVLKKAEASIHFKRFMGISVEAIAKEIGVSKRTFYRRWTQAEKLGLDPDTPFSQWIRP